MVGTSFNPSSLTVGVGAVVPFINNSGIEHNVQFPVNPPGVADIGNHSSGTTNRTFNTLGNWQFSCSLHAGMNGTVIVQ